MGRPRMIGTMLPPNVHAVRKKRRIYLYYQENRGTKYAGPRIPLGIDYLGDLSILHEPEFWQRLKAARGCDEPLLNSGTFTDLITQFKASPEWVGLRPNTRKSYSTCFDFLLAKIGDQLVRDLTSEHVLALRNIKQKTPTAANQMVSILQALINWSI